MLKYIGIGFGLAFLFYIFKSMSKSTSNKSIEHDVVLPLKELLKAYTILCKLLIAKRKELYENLADSDITWANLLEWDFD